MEFIGWIGTALVIIGYYPQIHHLWKESCAWGISIQTWLMWLLASVLLLIYCISRGEILLSVVQVSGITAILVTIILVRKSNKICPHHFAKAVNEKAGARHSAPAGL